MLTLTSVSLKEANAFVAAHHRHHKPVTGHKFSIGCAAEGRLVGVAIVGRPVSRYLDNGLTLEVTRLCTTGEKNACSMLYSAAARTAKAIGYPQDHHLHVGHGGRSQYPGGGLDVYGAGRGKTLDRQTLSRCGPLPAADEIAV